MFSFLYLRAYSALSFIRRIHFLRGDKYSSYNRTQYPAQIFQHYHAFGYQSFIRSKLDLCILMVYCSYCTECSEIIHYVLL